MAFKITKKDAKPFRGQRWVLTVHGQHQLDFNNLKSYFDSDKIRCAVIAKEFGKFKIHPHWQVYFELTNRTDQIRNELIKIFGHENFHVEKAFGTKDACVSYVYAVDKHWEIGFVEYNKNISIPARYIAEDADFWSNIQLRQFQKDILDIVKAKPCKRTIYWFYEEKGNTGKTCIAEYLHIFHGAIITGGTPADMKHAVTRWQEITHCNPVTIVIDLAKSDKFSYESAKGIESIKNGLFFSGKYESGMTHSVRKPHVFVFSNKNPSSFGKISEFFSIDRWKIFKISKNFKLIRQAIKK